MLSEIIEATVLVLTIAIVGRALLSWWPNVNPSNPAVEFLFTITEPILMPIRRIMPRMGMIDFTPLVAIILLQVIGGVLAQAVA